MRARRFVNLAGALAIAQCSLALSVPPAHAGAYKMYSCNVPHKPTSLPSAAPWSVELDGLHTYYFNECASGGAFGIGLNVRYMTAFSTARLVLARPALGPQSTIGITRYRTWVTASLGPHAFINDGGAFSPPGGTTPDAAPWVSAPFSRNHGAVYIRLQCTTSDCYFDSGRPLQVRGVEVDLQEDAPPEAVIDGGTLLMPGLQSGSSTLSYTATDQESGVARVEALVGDVVVATEDLASNPAVCTHTEWNACPVRRAGDLTVDTSALPPGVYPVALRVTDAAGNRRLVTAQYFAAIGSSSGGGSNGVGATAVLSATFQRGRTTHTTNFGRSVRLRGRLSDAGGNPIPRGRIAVIERPVAGRSKSTSSTVMTDVNGRFAHLLSGRRPSRNVHLQYYGGHGSKRPIASRRLQFRVRAASTFKVSLRGVVVRYSGRVQSRPVPRGGTRLFIQGRAAGGAWQRFAARRTNSKGRFAGRYRLRVRRPGIKLQFRVEIPKQSGYPFAPRNGPIVTRVVR